MENSDDELQIPDKETCQKLIEEFSFITGADEALAQFFLQETQWKLQASLNNFFESENGKPTADTLNDSDVAVTFQSIITTKPPDKFRFLTWNLDGLDEHNLKKRTKAVTKILGEEKPDIVFFQEVIPVTYSYMEERLPQYTFLAGGSEDYFTATLVNKTTVYIDNHNIIHFNNTTMGRNILLVDAHIGKLKLRLLNTHLESTKEFSNERKVQLKKAFQLLKCDDEGIVSILAGDLNLRDSEVNEVGIPQHVVDVWVATGSKAECQYTWDLTRNTNKSMPSRFQPRLRFDRVYLHQKSPLVRVQHFGLEGLLKVAGTQSFPSDHWGITTSFKISDIERNVAITDETKPSSSLLVSQDDSITVLHEGKTKKETDEKDIISLD